MKIIPVDYKLVTFVDDEDYNYLSRWTWRRQPVKGRSYAITQAHNGIRYTTFRMHRLIMESICGPLQNGMAVDHIDGDGLNNRRSNLRICNHLQNMQNQLRRTDNLSGFKGVSWKKSSSKWLARITVDKKVIHLGLFGDKLEAARAYNAAALKHFGEFARLNEVP